MTIKLSPSKMYDISRQSSFLLSKTVVLIRDLASFIGTIVATFPDVQYGPLYYRHLEWNKIYALAQNN